MINWIRINNEERWAQEEVRKKEQEDPNWLRDGPWQPPEEKAKQRREQFKRDWKL